MSGLDDSAVVSTAPLQRDRDRSDDDRGWDLPLLSARPNGWATRFARAAPSGNPVVVFVLAALLGLLVICALSIALGFVVTHFLLDASGVRSADNALPDWLARNRSGTLTDISSVGTEMAGALVLPILVGLLGIMFAVMRKWGAAAFAVFVLLVESATYRATSLADPRQRPGVHRLDNLPADASYPSGHTAAAIAVYAGIVLLISSRLDDGRQRAALWTAAITIVIVVALSRMYRGMHHPIDILAGVLIGCAAIATLVFACRAAAAAADARDKGATR